ncbi:MAG: hypothetical protein V3S43_06375 [Acidimicrobiia bacterium]
MGRSARRAREIVKHFAKTLAPTGIRLIGQLVSLAGNTDMGNTERRETVVTLAKGALKDVEEQAIRAAVEVAVNALKRGQDKLDELGSMETGEEDSPD